MRKQHAADEACIPLGLDFAAAKAANAVAEGANAVAEGATAHSMELYMTLDALAMM
jgi:hypothetical protein